MNMYTAGALWRIRLNNDGEIRAALWRVTLIYTVLALLGGVVVQRVERWTCDQ